MSKWKNRFAFFEIRGRRFGAEISRVEHGGVPYLDRYILYVGGPTLRLHKFWRGDDDRAPHDHPWPFWTFPLSSYTEQVFRADGTWFWNRVRGWRWSFRPAEYRHIVVGRHGKTLAFLRPFWTFVVTGRARRTWGFWPTAKNFVAWRSWPASEEQTDLLKQRPRT